MNKEEKEEIEQLEQIIANYEEILKVKNEMIEEQRKQLLFQENYIEELRDLIRQILNK